MREMVETRGPSKLFGILLGSGLAVLVAASWPSVFPGGTWVAVMACLGALLGAGFHRTLSAIPLLIFGRSMLIYAQLLQILELRRRDLIDMKTCRSLAKRLLVRHLLSEGNVGGRRDVL